MSAEYGYWTVNEIREIEGLPPLQTPEPTSVSSTPSAEPSARDHTPQDQAIVHPTPSGRAPGPAAQTPPATNGGTTPKDRPSLEDPFLGILAAMLDDLERPRTATQNRYRELTRTGTDKDGLERGLGLDERLPEVARLARMAADLEALEHQAVLNLQRQLRTHPLWPWIKAQKGIGPKQAARLLAAVGDPYWHPLHLRPRTVSELWAYCGYHTLPVGHGESDTHATRTDGATLRPGQRMADTQLAHAGSDRTGSDPGQEAHDTQGLAARVAARRRRGQRANWSTTAKTRAYLIAESCMKQRQSPYRAVYEQRRAHTATSHPDWTDGHSHNDALRITAKRILRDLWREARRIHQGDPS